MLNTKKEDIDLTRHRADVDITLSDCSLLASVQLHLDTVITSGVLRALHCDSLITRLQGPIMR